MSRPTYFQTHDRARLKKWGKAHLVPRGQETKASLETECGRRFFRDQVKGDGEDDPTCVDCREAWLGKPPRQHIPPGIGKLPQPKRRRRRTRGRGGGPRPDIDADAALVGAMASTLMGKMLRFMPGRRGRR